MARNLNVFYPLKVEPFFTLTKIHLTSLVLLIEFYKLYE